MTAMFPLLICISYYSICISGQGVHSFVLFLENNVPDHVYTMAVNIGGRNLNLIIDTASSNLWTADASLTDSQIFKAPGYPDNVVKHCPKLPLYGYNISLAVLKYRNWQNLMGGHDLNGPTPYITNCTRFNATYAIGNVTGYFVSDKLQLPGSTTIAKNYTFGLVVSDSSYVSAFSSGVFGLGFANRTIGNTVPALDSVYPPKYSQIFSLYLRRYFSRLLLGDPLDPDNWKYKFFFKASRYRKHSLIRDNLFMINANAVGFVNGLNFSRKSNILIDSGTSYLVAPNYINISKVIKQSFKCIGNHRNCVYKSDLYTHNESNFTMEIFEIDPQTIDIQKMPILTFYWGNNHMQRYDLEWCYYVFTEKDLNNNTHYLIGITQIFDINSTWVLGDMFLRKYFVTFDKMNKQLGIAPARFASKVSSPIKFCYDNYWKNDIYKWCSCWPKNKEDFIINTLPIWNESYDFDSMDENDLKVYQYQKDYLV